jgi:hypothetical protein
MKERIILDIETLEQKGDKYKMNLGAKDKILIGIYDGETYLQFSDFTEMLEYLFNEFKDFTVYAHNGGKYDYMYLLEECLGKYKITNIIKINSSVTFNLRRDKNIIKFRDSIRLIPGSLEKLCKAYDCQHKKIKLEYDYPYPIEIISEYLKYDCLALFEVIEKFEKEMRNIISYFNFDRYITIAQMSFSILQKQLNGICDNYFTKETENWIRESYYGGRVECYKKYGKGLFYYDVNSLYPFAMLDKYPIGRHYYMDNPQKILKLIKKGNLGIVECEIDMPYSKICLLPYRCDKRLYFPYGHFSGCYTSVELKEAIIRGAVIKPKCSLFYSESDNIFYPFIKKFYGMKENNVGVKREIAKYILNTSYGKFGQRRKQQQIFSLEEKFNSQYDDFEILSDYFFSREKVTYKNRKINPIYASFITAYSRIYMYQIMERIGFDNIYYTDTDSIICSKKLDKSLIHNTAIGLLKEEYKNVTGIWLAPKLYGFKGINLKNEETEEIKMKGVDYSVKKEINFKKFCKISENMNFCFTAKRMVGFSSKFNMVKYREGKEFAILDKFDKELKCLYDKRKLCGNDFLPICIKEIEQLKSLKIHT